MDLSDLKEGMEINGTVRNVIDFGVFVDIGVHQDGLVHVSELSEKFVQDAKTVLTVGDVVKVRVLAVDAGQKRISLSMKQESAEGVAGAGVNAKHNSRNAQRSNEKALQGHATIADLKAKLSGKSQTQQKKPQVQIGKVNSMLKQILKKGR